MNTKIFFWRIAPLVLLFVGLFFIIASLVGVREKRSGTEPKKYGGVYRMAHSEIINSLDPRKVVFNTASNVIQAIYDPLIRVSDDLRLLPSVCSSWEVVNNGNTFICHIQPGIRFHDGRELTSEDVLYSLSYLSDSHGNSLEIDKLYIIKGMQDYAQKKSHSISGVVAKDKYTVQIDLVNSCPHFPYLISTSRFVVVPKDLNGHSEDDFFRNPIGTGPFKFVRWEGSELALAANMEYFKGRPYLNGLVFKYYPEKNMAIDGFRNDEVDDLFFYNINEVQNNIPNESYVLVDTYATIIVFPNNSRPPFNDRLMRKLLFSAIDVVNLVPRCYPTSKISYGIIPKGIMGYSESERVIEYSMMTAREIAEEVNREGKSIPNVSIYYSESDMNDCSVDMINLNFSNLKLPWRLVKVTSENLSKYFFDGTMDAEIELIGVKNEDALSILKFFSSSNAENLARINDERIDTLIDKVQYVTDPKQRASIYSEIDALITKNDYALPVVSPRIYSVWNKRFKSNDYGASRLIRDFTQIWQGDGI